MPEATVDEDDLAQGAKGDVGRTGKVLAVQAVAVAESVKQATDCHLGLRVAGTNRSHGSAPLFGNGH